MQPKGTKTKQQNWGQSSSRNETKQQPGGDKAAAAPEASGDSSTRPRQPRPVRGSLITDTVSMAKLPIGLSERTREVTYRKCVKC